MIVEQFDNRQPVQTRTVANKIIHNIHILDRSGSMKGAKFKNAVSGILDEIKVLKKIEKTENVTYTQTIVAFSHSYEINTLCFRTKLNNLNLTKKSFGKADGYTALNDAIGLTLDKFMDTKDQVLVKIFTDGEENNSTTPYRNNHVLKSLLNLCKEKGWTITFVGTKFDVKKMQILYNLDESNTFVHDNTPESITDSFVNTVSMNTNYAKRVVAGEDVTTGYYTKTINND